MVLLMLLPMQVLGEDEDDEYAPVVVERPGDSFVSFN